MFIQQNHVRIAVNRIGGPTKTSNLLGVSNGAVHAWIKARRIANIDLAKKVAELAGMQVEEVRPC
jgi:hypothetical protein